MRTWGPASPGDEGADWATVPREQDGRGRVVDSDVAWSLFLAMPTVGIAVAVLVGGPVVALGVWLYRRSRK